MGIMEKQELAANFAAFELFDQVGTTMTGIE